MNLTYPIEARGLKRFNEIVGILARYGLSDFVTADSPEFLKEKFIGPDGEDLSTLTVEARVRMAITELGTTFIKFGQMMSTRADMVGPELAEELSSLQAHVPPDPPEVARQLLEAELGCPVENVFAYFEEEPISSASIGQVHLARLRDGSEVVVKIQHAGIEEKVREDLKIIANLAELAESQSAELRRFQPRALARDFERILLREMDFTCELRNMETIIENFANNPYLHLPKPYPSISTERVLTMERLHGFSVADRERVKKENIDTRELAIQGANIFLDMIFRDGVYHADPHPGNIFVLYDGRIGLLDCGKVERIDEKTQEEFEDVANAFVSKDTTLLTDELLRVSSEPPGLDRDALRADIGRFVSSELGKDVEQFDMKAMIYGCLSIVRTHRLILPPRVNMLFMVLVQLEGTSRVFDTSFNLSKILRDYQHQHIQRKYSPQRIWKRVHRSYRDWDHLIVNLPRDLTGILQRLHSGTLNIKLELSGLDRPLNRLVYGIIVAALFMGSSNLWANDVAPHLFGVSLIGAFGSVLSLVLGLILIRRIFTSGGLD